MIGSLGASREDLFRANSERRAILPPPPTNKEHHRKVVIFVLSVLAFYQMFYREPTLTTLAFYQKSLSITLPILTQDSQ